MIYIIPLTLLIIVTYKLVKFVKETRKVHAQLVLAETVKDRQKNENEVTLSLVMVVCLFCFTQFLGPVRRTMEMFIPMSNRRCPSFWFYFIEVNTLLKVVNYSVNFIFYFMFNKSFRRELRQFLRRQNAVVH